jgi:hypothetical protein
MASFDEGPLSGDPVEKVAAWFFEFPFEKIDLSYQPTNHSCTEVKGEKTPENLARKTVGDFFNSIRVKPTFKCPRNGVDERPLMAARSPTLNWRSGLPLFGPRRADVDPHGTVESLDTAHSDGCGEH